MGDLGLANAYGAEGAADALRQMIKDRLEQQQRQFENDRLTRNDQQSAEEHAMKMQDYRDALAQRAQGERDTAAGKALPNLGIGTAVDPSTFAQTFAGTSSAPNFTPERTLPSTQMAGGMPLDPTQPSVQKTTEAPRQMTGRMLSMGTDQQRTGEEQKVLRGRLLANPNLTDLQRTAIEAENAGLKVPANVFEPKQPANLVQVDEGGKPVYRPASEAVGKPAYHAPQQTATVTIQTVDDQGNPVTRVVKKSDAVGKDFAKPDGAQTATQKKNATNVLAHIADIEQEAEQINKLGLMGPVGGRWSDFMSGKIGAGELAAGNPQAAELLGQFRSDVGLLKSGMAMVHGGARGGGSPAIMARMDALINANKMDLPLFKGATASFKKWLTQYAGKPEAGGGATSEKPTAEELIKKYGGD